MDLLQEISDLLTERPGLPIQLLCDDNSVVASSVGGMLFQKRVTQAHHPDPALPVGVTGEYPHIGIIAGNHILDHHGVRITGCVAAV